MVKRRDIPTRHDLTEHVNENETAMDEKERNLDQVASDVETVRRTLENLDLGGTSEGSEALEKSIENAEDVTEKEFDREDEELERIQSENKEFEGELQDRRGSSESDVGKISDASSRIETNETVKELERAKEAGLRDIDFLVEQIDRARGARERSNATQESHRSRVRGGKRRV